MSKIDTTKIDEVITGYKEPYIYSFTTETIPNYTKVGDTTQGVNVRLKQWRDIFPNLEKLSEHSAVLKDNDKYFRDYSVHQFLENNDKTRLTEKKLEEINHEAYYSNEFFENVNEEDIDKAIQHIKDNSDSYDIYSLKDKGKIKTKYASTGTWSLRPNQEETVLKFIDAVSNYKTNLLMYAVMRFGKSFTALCCAKAICAKIVVIVSAKADVKDEWRKTVQSAENFSDYEFLTSHDLEKSDGEIKKVLNKKDKNRVVIFLTLQDLQGENVKDKHKELLEKNIDLLIIDETHFGARAEKYSEKIPSGKDEDYFDPNEAKEIINKKLKCSIKLHLSGTPYRILMSSEFEEEEKIIAKYQYSDIIEAKNEWDKKNLNKDNIEEWDNPYFGFPEMIRFGFNPNESSLKKMEELKSKGELGTLNDLLRPESIDKKGEYKKFKFEKEVLELFQAIDGSKDDDNIFSFLNYDPIKEGKMCQHIVCVLPYKASCDALEDLLNNNKCKFNKLKDYEIINIAGLDNKYKNTNAIKNKIKTKEDSKTLTLTVNRMLTGSTVPQWDTMIFLKDTSSPQEYDQAIFRLQNQNVKIFIDKNNNIIKDNKKPQTLLVDFNPYRMFTLQEQKAFVYNVVKDEKDCDIKKRIEKDFDLSPMFVINNDKIEKVTPDNVMNYVSKYSKERGIREEVDEISIDASLKDLDFINKEKGLNSKEGLSFNAHEGEGEGKDIDPSTKEKRDTSDTSAEPPKKEKDAFEDKVRAYYSRILIFAFLTKSKVKTLSDIISKIDDTCDNKRIAKNINLKKENLEQLNSKLNSIIIRDLDQKIRNMNNLSHDDSLSPIERAKVALTKFSRLGISEIVTPQSICKEMIKDLPINDFKNPILDIASKIGEFAIAIVEKYEELNIPKEKYKKMIYSIPTSSLTYEFTRKVYECLGLPIENIAEKFNTYDLLKVKKNKGKKETIDYDKVKELLCQKKIFNEIDLNTSLVKGKKSMKFEAIVGNPPYQMGHHMQIYPFFYLQSIILGEYVSLIFPVGWQEPKNKNNLQFMNKPEIKEDKQIKCIDNRHNVFTGVAGAEWTNIILWIYGSDNKLDGKQKIFTEGKNPDIKKLLYESKVSKPQEIIDLSNIISNFDGFESIKKSNKCVDIISNRNQYGIGTKFSSIPNYKDNLLDKKQNGYNIKIYGPKNQIKYISDSYKFPEKPKIENINKYKLYVPYAWGNMSEHTHLGGQFADIIIAYPNEACLETYLEVCPSDDIDLVKKCAKYFMTQFFRALLYVNKKNQHSTSCWQAIPRQDFSEIWWDSSIDKINEKLMEKYNLPDNIKQFIREKFQPKDESNIINFDTF
ncbi:MAG: DEAD/DEAH box helicase family protein [Abditibacteriota bacterium]|nr:DEAD/DEAH box helicase family protein [Abditibacteriota bacterium]